VDRTDYVVIGLGITGLSCIDFLVNQGLPVLAMDTRQTPPQLDSTQTRYPSLSIYTGESWPQDRLNQAKAIVVSPGVSTAHPAIVLAKQAGAEIIGDVELFARFNQAPVIAITGANGKSTVTTLVGEMARAAGKQVAVIGNIGVPVLNALQNASHDLIVMELSSFQLETTSSLRPLAATVLNITPDHMDRYPTFQDYINAKHRVYHHAKNVIINKEDSLSDSPLISPKSKKWFFTLDEPATGEFGLRYLNNRAWLACGSQNLLCETELKIVGKHNFANMLSALALGTAAGLDLEAMLQALRCFEGLPHRCQWVREHNQVRWFNDSKGTNIGACQAALMGLGQDAKGKIVLILGGDGKGADFKELGEPISKYCRAIIVKGKDADKIMDDLKETVSTTRVKTMEEAVKVAQLSSHPGDIVLLSPACASLDQYRDFAHRGEVFMEAVKKIVD
jgi:UDP-N-acetylmuramoylalanine--D-glutamate ligase